MSEELVKFPSAPRGNPIRCKLIDAVGHEVEFETLTDAAIYMVGEDGNIRSAVTQISRALSAGKMAFGLKWEKLKDE